ncbi:hypothetical protein A3Q56_08716 [Intoshia linei]|uniref:Uncharacterized protein n=1 Tax=Intoshia linei TaxID=1819745 RepID=A0A177AND9_9BILA|nr:hypothetical protein A3Q56_08716 [Intoshia linei]
MWAISKGEVGKNRLEKSFDNVHSDTVARCIRKTDSYIQKLYSDLNDDDRDVEDINAYSEMYDFFSIM